MFENLVLLIIVVSSIVLLIENPLDDPNSNLSQTTALLDQIFTFLFLLEAIIKILAFGFISTSLKGKQAYLFNGWNILDLFVLTSSIIEFSFSL